MQLAASWIRAGSMKCKVSVKRMKINDEAVMDNRQSEALCRFAYANILQLTLILIVIAVASLKFRNIQIPHILFELLLLFGKDKACKVHIFDENVLKLHVLFLCNFLHNGL